MSVAKTLIDALEVAGLPTDDSLIGRPIVIASMGTGSGCRVTALTAIRAVVLDRRTNILNIVLDEAPAPVDFGDGDHREMTFVCLMEPKPDGSAVAEIAYESPEGEDAIEEIPVRFELA